MQVLCRRCGLGRGAYRGQGIAQLGQRVGGNRQPQRLLHRADVCGHELFGQSGVAFFQSCDDLHVVFTGLLGVVRGLVQHCDQCGAGGEVAQRVGQQAVTQALGQAHVEVTQQKTARANVVTLDGRLLLLQVLFEPFQSGLLNALQAADQAGFDDPAGFKGLAGFVLGWLDHVPAPARADGDDAARCQAGQRLAHHRAAAVEQHGQRLLAQAGARGEFLRHYGFDDAGTDVGGGGHCHR